MNKICVVGLGYIGLPTAAMLASRGHDVVGCDINASAVESVNKGSPHFFEPDLQMLLSAAVQTGRLRAQTTPEEADYFLLAVPTPFKDGNKPDMSFVEAAADVIAPRLKPGNTVILESTSPVGATEALSGRLAASRPDLVFPRYQQPGPIDVHVAHCPERVMPGQTVRELVSNDRIIGGMTEECANRALALYESFVSSQAFLTDCRTAEFVKLAENSFRDVNIAFANELSLICDELEVDVWRAIDLANRHPRVSILRPGAGVGGHCIAVDPLFIIDAAPRTARLLRTAREVNNAKPVWVTEQIRRLAARFRDPVVACFGLAYKADVDDLRESPSLEIARSLAEEHGIRTLIVEPNIRKLPTSLARLCGVTLVDIETARQEADIVAFLVPHRPFRRLDRKLFLNKMVVDAIGIMS
ncbi:MAG: UDP-N-acetyl-D-mannosamine dehydrogenase [Acetobacteraceae bacterium]|nr:UDP-N-acetyl-D-mannosamine dehydrogenase [Acetobacteraceae bacterium]